MSQALPRKLHTAASCSRLRRSSLQANQPRAARSVWTTTPVTSSAPSGPGWPSTRTYGSRGWCGGARRRRRPGPAETTRSTWPAVSGSGRNGIAGRRCSMRDVAVGAERLAVGERELGAGGAEVAQADPAVDVLAEVDDVHAGPRLGDRDRAELLDRAHRRRPARRRARRTRGRSPRPGATRARRTPRCVQPGSSRRRSSHWPSMRSAATMWPSRPAPRRRRCRRRSRCRPRARRAAGRGTRSGSPHWSAARRMPTWPRYHPSASRAPSTLPPLVEQLGDVVGLHLRAGGVLGEARGQLVGRRPGRR